MWTRLVTPCVAVFACSCAAERLRCFEYAHPAMGTRFRLAFYAADERTADAAAAAAFGRIDELDRMLSDYDPASELSRLAETSERGAPTGPIAVSDELFEILAAAVAVGDASRGAFDVTVGPYVRLWRRARRTGELPSSARLAEARASVGLRGLELDRGERTVRLLAPSMRLDLGGIAKGYALDAVVQFLAGRGIERVLAEGGGDIRLGDPPPGRTGWRIALVDLEDADRDERPWCLELARAAISTSGDLERYVEIGGKRYSHIVDPRTGQALVERRLVTVIAASSMQADALATAISVLGAGEGIALSERFPGVMVQVTELHGERCGVSRSARFPPLTRCESGGTTERSELQ